MKAIITMQSRMAVSIVILFLAFGCQKETMIENQSSAQLKSLSADSTECLPDSFKLYAGQTIDVGYLLVNNDAENLYVTYQLNGENLLGEAQLWVGTNPELVPKTQNGTPIPGQFPYKMADINASSYTFVIALADIISATDTLCGKSIYLYAHGTTGGETLWSFGTPFNSPRWGWYSTYSICCPKKDPDPRTDFRYETAFAKFKKMDGGYVFTTNPKSNPEKYPSLNLTNNRWGWAGYLTIPGTYYADVWAGAGLNKTSNGTKVGTVKVETSAGSVTVTYTFINGNLIRELHSYVSALIPTTLAPGQYGNTVYFDPKVSSYSATYTIADYTGGSKVWVILHSVAAIPVPVP